MRKKKRTFTNEQKFKIVLEAIKGQKQITEIASEYNVHPNQITNWKRQFMENGAEVFSKKAAKKEKEQEEETGELYKKIGKQQVEIDWLKKTLNPWTCK